MVRCVLAQCRIAGTFMYYVCMHDYVHTNTHMHACAHITHCLTCSNTHPVHMHNHTHTHARMHAHTYTHTHTLVCSNAHTHAHTHTHTHTHTHAHTHS